VTKDFISLVYGLLSIREKLIVDYAKYISTYEGIGICFHMSEAEVKAVLDKHNITLD
jgi:hypothetical protein